MDNRDGKRTFKWTIDLFDELDRLESGKWFWLDVMGEVLESGEPIITELRLVPKRDVGFPPPPAGMRPEAVTKELLRELAKKFDRISDDAVAWVELCAPIESAVEYELRLANLQDGSTIRKRGVDYFRVWPDGRRVPYEPEDEREYEDLARAMADESRRRRVSRQRWTDDEIREVAVVYKEALRRGDSGPRAIMRRYQVSRSKASVLIRNARAAGYLPPARPGRKQDA